MLEVARRFGRLDQAVQLFKLRAIDPSRCKPDCAYLQCLANGVNFLHLGTRVDNLHPTCCQLVDKTIADKPRDGFSDRRSADRQTLGNFSFAETCPGSQLTMQNRLPESSVNLVRNTLRARDSDRLMLCFRSRQTPRIG